MRVKESTMGPIPRKPRNQMSSERLVIPLVKSVTITEEEKEYLTFKLRSDPKNDKSITYSVQLAPFNIGNPEEWLTFLKTLKIIFKGQNLTNGVDQFVMTRRLLDGQALSVFENEVTTESLGETTADLDKALDAVTKDVFPTNALAQQKRGMRRFIKKPLTMKISHLVARLTELNDQLTKYPYATDSSKLSEDEIKEILEFAIPNRWKKQMTLQRFHVYTKTLPQVVEFCKDMEDYEKQNPDENPSAKTEVSKTGTTSTKRKRKLDNLPVCIIHGPGHATEDCKKIQVFGAEQRAKNTKARKFKSQELKPGYKVYSKEEINTMIEKSKKTAVETYRKKRKLDSSIKKQRSNF